MKSAGGLVTAVAPVVIQCGGRWVGWPGPCPINDAEQIPEACPGDITPTAGILSKQVKLQTIAFISNRQLINRVHFIHRRWFPLTWIRSRWTPTTMDAATERCGPSFIPCPTRPSTLRISGR